MGEVAERVVLVACDSSPRDARLKSTLAAGLRAVGCEVVELGPADFRLDLAPAASRRVSTASAAVVLVTPEALGSELHEFQVRRVREAAGRPRIVVVRHGYLGPLPPSLAGAPVADGIACGDADDADEAARRVLAVLAGEDPVLEPPAAGDGPPADLEPVGGAVPLGSPFYVERETDAACASAVARRDSIVLLRGPRQSGKTSLLSRGLERARQAGLAAAAVDLQSLNIAQFDGLETFYCGLGEALADQLGLGLSPVEEWQPQRSPNRNFEQFIRRRILAPLDGPLVWGLDEVDRLFAVPFAGEVFALFRSWHNARALDPAGPWADLTLLITFATEAHLFIADLNQSPFNVGTRLTLRDFTEAEVADLNRRYGSPLRDADELARLTALIGGQPYLARRALHELASGMSLARLEADAAREDGPFGDHLRRVLVSLIGEPALLEAMLGVLRGERLSDPHLYYRLFAAGLLTGQPAAAAPRCRIYATYLASWSG